MTPRPLHKPVDASLPGFDALFELEPLLLHSVDERGIMLNVSSAWARLLGYERSDLIGRRSVDIMTPRSRAYALTTGLPLLFQRGHVTNIGYEFIRADGRPLPVLLSSGAVRDEAGRFIRSLTVITDDRRAHYAERALGARRQRDRGADADMRRALERFSHQTRTPLNAVLGFAALMQHGELPEHQAGRLREIVTAANDLRRQFDRLLEEIETGPEKESESTGAQPRAAPAAASPLPLAPMRVLLAVKESRQQDALREALRAGGHQVVTAANGYEAIEALFAGPMDLALIDLEMPGLSGPATVAQIRRSGRAFQDIPIVACAEEGRAPDAASLTRQGIDGLVSKPTAREELEDAMHRALQARNPTD